MRNRRLAWYWYFILGVLLWCGECATAKADVVLEASQVCYSEAGVTNHRECAAILESLRARALRLGRPFRTHMSLYSGLAFDRSRRDGRRWLAFLNPAGSRPAGWPVHASWTAQQTAWHRLRAFVARWLRRPWNPCDGVPEDWGVHRAVRRYRGIYPRSVTLECNLGPGRHNTFLRPNSEEHTTQPQDPNNEPQAYHKERVPVPRISFGFGNRGPCRRLGDLSDKDLDRLP